MAEPFVATTITITREFRDADNDEADVVAVEVDGDAHLTVMLGMLELAKGTLVAMMADGS